MGAPELLLNQNSMCNLHKKIIMWTIAQSSKSPWLGNCNRLNDRHHIELILIQSEKLSEYMLGNNRHPLHNETSSTVYNIVQWAASISNTIFTCVLESMCVYLAHFLDKFQWIRWHLYVKDTNDTTI